MAKSKPYQGHRNWAHWNVSLWIMNEEPLYRMAQRAVKFSRTLDDAAKKLVQDLPPETPDGAKYSFTAVRAALENWGG